MKWFVMAVLALLVMACEDGTRRIYPNDKGTATTDGDEMMGDDLLSDEAGDSLIEPDRDEQIADDWGGDDFVQPEGEGFFPEGDVDHTGDTPLVGDDGPIVEPDEDIVGSDEESDDETPQPDDGPVVTPDDDDSGATDDDPIIIPDDGDVLQPDDGDVVQPDLDADTCVCSTGACCDGCHYRPASYVCRPAAGECDVAEHCTGASAACPADQFASTGTPCDDGVFCNGDDTCNGNGGCTVHPGNPCGNFVCSENQGTCCEPGWAGADCEICVRFVSRPGVIPVVGDGLSWAMAFNDIQQAIDSANDAAAATCEVWVAAGTYYAYKNSVDNTIQLRGKVPLYGGFAGTEWIREERDWVTNVTIIDGRQSAGSGNRVSHVMTGDNGALVDGFTIQEGRAVTGSAYNYTEGGALYIRNVPEMTVRNCVFAMNTALAQSDDTYIRGGAISASNTTGSPHNLTIENCVFRYNAVTISPNDYGFGGAIYANGPGTLVIRNSVFDTNSVAQSANGSLEGSGGAVNVFSGRSLTVTNSLFHDNSLVSSGTANGGAIRGADASLTIINCTFSQNSAKNGGAVANVGSTNTTIVNSILYANNATNVWNNTRQLYDETGGGTITVRYSDIQMTNASVFPGTANINSDPLFVDPANNDFHLKVDVGGMQISPCIDAANDSVAPETDLEGNARFDVPVYGTSIADMGCYEFVY